MNIRNHFKTNPSSRRRFAKIVAAWLVALPIGTSVGSAQTPSTTKQAPAPPTPPPPPTPQQPSPTAEAFTEVVHARYGNRITADELTRIKRDIDGNLRSAERLRAYKLKNGDEPDFIFSA